MAVNHRAERIRIATPLMLLAIAGCTDLAPTQLEEMNLSNRQAEVAGPLMNSARAAPSLEWQTVAGLPVPVRAAAAASDGRFIYVLGGNRTLGADWTTLNQIYDPRTDTWRSGAPFEGRRDFAMAVASPEGIHLIAGRDAQFKADHQVYDPRSDTWSSRAPLPEAIDAASINRHGNRIFVIGGNVHGTPLSEVYIYDRVRDRWNTGAAMPTPRFSAASAVHRGRILVAGGQTAGRQTTNALEAYHPAQDRWESLAPMPFNSEGLGAGRVLRGGMVGNRFCVFGGRLGPPSANALADTYCYDTERNTWTVGPDMLTPRIEMAFTDHGGWAYAIGGRTRDALATGAAERLGGGRGH